MKEEPNETNLKPLGAEELRRRQMARYYEECKIDERELQRRDAEVRRRGGWR